MIKIGDLVKIVKNAETCQLEAMGMLNTDLIGEVISENFDGFCVRLHDGDEEGVIMWFPESWIEKIDLSDIEVPENKGIELTIKFDKDEECIDISCENGMADLTSKETYTLYNLVEALYNLLEIE